MRAFLFILLSLLAIPTFSRADEEKPVCLDAARVADLKRSFKVLADGPRLDLCKPKNHARQLYETLIFLQDMDLSGPPAPYPWNQNILGENWLMGLWKLNHDILDAAQYYPYGNACTKNTAMFVQPEIEQTLFTCPAAFADDVTFVAAVFLHESRHHLGFSHVRCRAGYYESTDAKLANAASGSCDSSLFDRGAYAAEVEAYAKMAVSAVNLNPATQDSARFHAISRMETNFVRHPEKPEGFHGVLVREAGTGAYFAFNPWAQTLTPALRGMPPGRIVLDKSSLYTFILPDDHTLPARNFELLSLNELREYEPTSRMLIDYAAASPETRSALKDVKFRSSEFGIKGTLTDHLFKLRYHSRAQKDPFGDEAFEITFTQGNPVKFWTSDDLSSVNPNQLLVLTDDHHTFLMDLHDDGTTSVAPTQTDTFATLSEVADLGSQTVAVDAEGRLGTLEYRVFRPVAAFANRRFAAMSRGLELEGHWDLEFAGVRAP